MYWPYSGYPADAQFRPLEVPYVETRRHPVVLAGPIALLTLPPIVAAWIDDHATISALDGKLLPMLVAVAWLIAGVQFLHWLHGWFIVTQSRVMLFSGVVGQNKAVMPVQRVTDVATTRPIPRTLLGYCHVMIESAGQDQALHTVRFLDQPARVCQVMDLITDRPLAPVGVEPPAPLVPIPEERSLPGWWLVLLVAVLAVVAVALVLGSATGNA